MDKTWFREKLEARELNQTRVGALLGLDRSQISKILNGARELSPQEAADMAKVLAVPLDDLLRHAGVAVAQETKARVPVVGVADALGLVAAKFDGPKRIDRPGSGYGDLSAIRIAAPASSLDGWVAYFVPSRKVEPEAVGRLAVVESAAGKAVARYLGVLDRETARGAWRVVSLVTGAKPFVLDRAAIAWAAPVLWIQTNVL